MNAPQKAVTAEQLQLVAKKINLTVAAIAAGAGLSKAYISEFRTKARNLSDSQQAQLRSYLESQCEEHGIDFPEGPGSPVTKALMQGIGGMVERIQRPAILLSGDIPKAQVDQLTDLIDANRIKVTELLSQEFQPGAFGGDFSPETDDAIRQIFALLGLNYIAILILQGRNIARKLPDDFEPKTMGDWLSQYLAASPLATLLQVDPEPAESEGVEA